MILALWGAAGLIAGAVAWRALAPVLDAEVLARTNFRGRALPTAGGLLVVVAAVGVEAVRTVVHGPTAASAAVLVAVAGFAVLGLIDDVAGERVGAGGDRGFRGHLRAMASGRLTTGGLKLVGGGAVALCAASIAAEARTGGSARWSVVVGGIAIAAAANLGNLLDRAPGRTAKVALVAFAAVLVAAAWAGHGGRVAPVAVVAGATLAALVPDVRERVMLGDTGANVVGAVAAVGVVLAFDTVVVVCVTAVLLVLNAVSEAVSFSRIIERVAPLRAIDRIGRMP